MILYAWFALIALLIGSIGFLIRYRMFKEMPIRILTYLILAFILGMTWDYIAIIRGHWFFPKEALLGIYTGIIPIEDIILMLALVLIAAAILGEKSKSRKFSNKKTKGKDI